MDPSLSVWVIDYDPSAAPGLPAVLGERSRVDPAGTIYFKVGPLDTDWSLTPGGGVGIVTSVTGTAPISSTGGTTPDISLDDTAVTPGSYTYSSITVDQKGRLTAASSGAAPAPASATYWVSTATAILSAEVDMGALGSGTLQQTTTLGVSTPTVFAGTTGSIPFYTANGQLSQDNAALFWNAAGDYMVFGGPADQVIQKEGGGGLYFGTATANPLGFYTNSFTWATISSAGVLTYAGTTGLVYTPSTNSFVMGTATPAVGVAMQVTKNQNAGTSFVFSNSSTGGSAYTNFILAQSDTFATGSTFGMTHFSTGSTFGSPYNADAGLLSLDSGTGNMHFWIDQNVGDFVWFTKATFPNPPERMRLETGGNLSVANLSAGGVVYATATTAVLKIGTSGEVAGAITWPAQGLVLISDGVNDAPVGIAGFNYDGTNDLVEISDDIGLAHYNLGSAGTGTYERVTATWLTNEWVLSSESAGGTVRNMVIQSDTATLTLSGGGGAYLVGGAVASAPYVLANSLAVTVASPASRASSAGATLNAISVLGSTVSVTGNTNITTAAGFNYINVAAPTFSGSGGAKTITTASTMVIAGPPAAAGDVTITLPMTFWVQAGRSRFDGHFTGAGSGSNLGFFGSNGVALATPTGSRGGNAALASLLTALASYNLIVDGTSA